MENKIEIPLSKTKIGLLFLGSLAFALTSIAFVLHPEEWTTSIISSPILITILGVFIIVFFGGLSVFLAWKMFDQKIGLTIDERGMTDNTNGTSVGLIEWGDITGIERLVIVSSKMLMIQTNKPEKYIARASNAIAKQAMKANYKSYGSPISIIASSLKIDFDELEELIVTEWQKRELL